MTTQDGARAYGAQVRPSASADPQQFTAERLKHDRIARGAAMYAAGQGDKAARAALADAAAAAAAEGAANPIGVQPGHGDGTAV